MRKTTRCVPFLVMAMALVIGACGADTTKGPTAGSATTLPAVISGAEVAGSWASHGRDLANSRATTNETQISANNVAQLRQVWSTANLKGVSATPIFADGVLYFGDWTGTAHALHAKTGNVLWSTDVETDFISGSVAIDGDHVYVGTFEARVMALNRQTGAVVWTMPVDDGPGSAAFGSLNVVDGMVMVGVASFDEVDNPDGSTFRGHVVALDAATGKEVWRYWTTNNDATSGPGIAVWSALSFDVERHLVYIPTGNNYSPPAGPTADAVVAVDSRTGKQIWVRQFTADDTYSATRVADEPDADVGAPPNLFDVNGRAAIGVGDKAGVFHALDRATGEVLWTSSLTTGGPIGGVMQSAAVQGDRIFVSSNKGGTTADLIALSMADGKEIWRVDVGSRVIGPVTWSNGVLYLGDESARFTAFGAADGKMLWQVTLPAPIAAGALVADGTLYLGFGFWLKAPPVDPQGGVIAYRLSGGGSTPRSDGSKQVPLGESVYIRSCGSCHGGDGSGAFGPSLKGIEAKYTLDAHLAIVGQGQNKMPAWKDVLSPEEIQAVVDYQRATFK